MEAATSYLLEYCQLLLSHRFQRYEDEYVIAFLGKCIIIASVIAMGWICLQLRMRIPAGTGTI